MLDINLLKEINQQFAKTRLGFTKLDREYNAGKRNLFGKLHGIFTQAYHRRDDLFLSGEIIYALTFKSFVDDFSSDKSSPTWIIFSPSRDIQDNPRFYYDIAAKLEDILTKKKLTKTEKIIRQVLLSNTEEPTYLEIPEPYNLGYLAYISVCYMRPAHISDFKVGVNLIVFNKRISNEVIYLPDRYWNSEYKSIYENKTVLSSEEVGTKE